MNTFWGCTTEEMDELAREIGAKAERLVHLLEMIRRSAEAVAWTGPDAETFRRRSTEVAGEGMDLVGALKRCGDRLDEEAQAQEICSQAESGTAPDDDPLRNIRAELPKAWKLGPKISAPLPDDGFPSWWPREGGAPLNPYEPITAHPLPTEVWEKVEQWWSEQPWKEIPPYVGGPLSREQPWERSDQPSGDAPFDIDPATLAAAEKVRTAAVSGIPYAGEVQLGMQMHETQGELFDSARGWMEDNGLGRYSPLVSLAEMPSTLAGVVLGEESVLGQTATNIDRSIANAMTATGEVSSALAQGDLAGAAGAAERGMFRQADITVDTVTTTAVPGVLETGAELLGDGADVADMVSPGAGARLREAEQFVDGMGQDYREFHDWATDGERFYELRREYAPMPWDQRG